MRTAFLAALYDAAARDSRVVLVNPDSIGYHCEDYRRDFPLQYLNTGIAEQNTIGVSAGLALTGRLPFVFNILAFNAFRCYEQVRLDICAMKLPVTLVGIGAGLDYGVFGPSHHTMEDMALMRALPGMNLWSPSDDRVAAALVEQCMNAPGPAYLRLHRSEDSVYRNGLPSLADGLAVLREGGGILIAATGVMVRRALEVAEALSALKVAATVIDVFRIKPFPHERFCELVRAHRSVVTIEEHATTGGLGSATLEALSDAGIGVPVRRFGLPDRFVYASGDRNYLHAATGLDAATLTARILE